MKHGSIMSQGPNVVYLMVFQPYLNINKGIVVGIAVSGCCVDDIGSVAYVVV